MKQTDVIQSVINALLREKTDIIDGETVTITQSRSGRNILALIENEYQYHGKTYKGDPTRMIEKIQKALERNRR